MILYQCTSLLSYVNSRTSTEQYFVYKHNLRSMEEDSKLEEKNDHKVNFTHEELKEITETALNELLKQDSFLSDLPAEVTLEEVNNQIALQYGKSITVYVIRGDEEKMPVIVPQAGGTVADLKKSIKRFISLKLNRQEKKQIRKKFISWKYVWKTYDLQFSDIILNDNNKKLQDLGIKNKSFVTFVKKRRKMKY